jgi:hypothetical protein
VIDSPRDDLIEKVRYGKMTPAEAEAEAARLNLKPFECRPKPGDFDPMKEVFWTLPMAVAWIAYRTADEVREWWDAYRIECWDWHYRKWRIGIDGPVHEGHFLEQRTTATLVLLGLAAIFDRASGGGPALKMTVDEARETALLAALREGLIEAIGINVATGTSEKIPVIAWHDLECQEQHDRDVVATPLSRLGGGLRYERVLVWRKAIIGMWPAIIPPLLTLPETMSPTGPGYMPLYCAAQWIATEGGKRNFDPNDEDIWKAAFRELNDRITSDQVRVIGTGNGGREPVSGHPLRMNFMDASEKGYST